MFTVYCFEQNEIFKRGLTDSFSISVSFCIFASCFVSFSFTVWPTSCVALFRFRFSLSFLRFGVCWLLLGLGWLRLLDVLQAGFLADWLAWDLLMFALISLLVSFSFCLGRQSLASVSFFVFVLFRFYLNDRF